MEKYVYRPKRFYLTVFIFTWAFWITAIFCKVDIALLLMLFGLLVPAVTAVITVYRFGNKALKIDFKKKS